MKRRFGLIDKKGDFSSVKGALPLFVRCCLEHIAALPDSDVHSPRCSCGEFRCFAFQMMLFQACQSSFTMWTWLFLPVLFWLPEVQGKWQSLWMPDRGYLLKARFVFHVEGGITCPYKDTLSDILIILYVIQLFFTLGLPGQYGDTPSACRQETVWLLWYFSPDAGFLTFTSVHGL